MAMTGIYSPTLIRHPVTYSHAQLDIEARVRWADLRSLSFTYLLKGDISSIRIPRRRTPRRTDRLWEHSCFEAFIGEVGKPEYYEFNFSPSREWAAYAFRGYREGGPVDDDELDPNISVRLGAGRLDLIALISLNRLPVLRPGSNLRLGLSAVIEDIGGRLSYWALKHPTGKPDFHHPDAFALELTLPGQTTQKRLK
jgi:hypothetical protein